MFKEFKAVEIIGTCFIVFAGVVILLFEKSDVNTLLSIMTSVSGITLCLTGLIPDLFKTNRY